MNSGRLPALVRIARRSLLAGLLLTAGAAQVAFSGLESAYSIRSLALTGAGAALATPESDRLNPAVTVSDSLRHLQFGWLRYPAGINGGLLALTRPGRTVVTVGLRHLNYGSFNGYDADAQTTGSYYSGDTWLTATLARRLRRGPLSVGVTAGLFRSQLADYGASVVTLTPGLLLDLPRQRIKGGLVLRNWGRVLDGYTARNEDLPTTLVAGFARRLAHLPLELAVDAGYRLAEGVSFLSLGGIFRLPAGLELYWGTSSDKLDQGSGDSVSKDYLAASGLALAYRGRKLDFAVGGYFYGPGAWISGVGVGVTL